MFRLTELGSASPDSFGAVIRRRGTGEIEPGSSFEVDVLPWADGVEELVSVGDQLPVWHTRDVGLFEVAAVDVESG